MRICPQCKKTYPDDLNYCLDDGAALTMDVYAADPATVAFPSTYSNAPTQVLSSIPTDEQVVRVRSVKWP